ncbi:LEAF RUST 10 DISEASE-RESISTANCEUS RECEPTOR-LIKE PROTEIN KINASE-like 1.2 isoform X1 [Malus domestica]|uniref:LEAF RUST 10 DISEASE-RESISTANCEUS RECEPTOR-LIKE PROTEIN KINASE-like 1.2 isoform X1 n=1 Tax=Malus domestica TaxID=3750 RepID=UPI0010AAD0F7|nr:LEAF RUST 10 DISEASE-RESISTANCE LOCUS RECEPTOR-LIKE PROTEIN KINASE-like 1.2 isoform X1 [Malus domestica]
MPTHFLLKLPISFLIIFHILITVILLPTAAFGEDDHRYTECRSYYDCGLLKNISYPFWATASRPQHCGREDYELTCRGDQYPVMKIKDQDFLVLNFIGQFYTMTIARSDLWDTACITNIVNTTLDYDRFSYVPAVRNLSLFYGCPPQSESVLNNFTCKVEGTDHNISYYVDDSLSRIRLKNWASCHTNIRVPIMWEGVDAMPLENVTTVVLKEVLKQGFQVAYDAEWELCNRCLISNGTCGSNSSNDSFLCLCGDGPHDQTCPVVDDNPWNWKRKVIVGVCTATATVAIMCLIFFVYQRRNRKPYDPSSFVTRGILSSTYSMDDDMEKGSTYLGVHIFSYKELEEATNYFDSAKELGDGGFGTVYHGNVHDGRAVAVKRLYENNWKRVEQFMNEIEILARLRHQNLVLLYGCTSRQSRELLLVYEYIPNGTLAEHLHGGRAKPGALPWLTRINIAIETASALSYLHASDIIHRDVKTTNILLDNNFGVKVADFGLSRLFPMNVTHISTAPQGTPGYVDPEYNQCYQLTSKSDVYSFGVVLIELISSMPAVDITRHRHEINLSTMAINKIKNHTLHELVDPYLGFESDSRTRKMIIAVAELAFRCLQTDKDVRPSMVEVLNELKWIQSDDFNIQKAEEIDILADDIVPLKSDPLPPSPDSVALNLTSASTTPNGSGKLIRSPP